jgi:tetratricopeptide (TPR) repeat protein
MLDWSYDQLSEPEQVLLNRLSVFAGGWTVQTAEAVCAGDVIHHDDILPLLLSLVRKSLIVVEQNGEHTRYHLLETVRQYVGGKLQMIGEAENVREQHLNYFLTLAERGDDPLSAYWRRKSQWLGFQQNETEHDNLRTALSWAVSRSEEAATQRALRLAGALGLFWMQFGYLSEGRSWLTAVLSKTNAPSVARARALSRAGWIASLQGDYALAEVWLEESLCLLRESEDQFELARTLYHLGSFRINRDLLDAIPILEECVAIGRENDLWDLIGEATRLLAEAAIAQRNWAKARSLFEESLAIYQIQDDDFGVTILIGHLAIFAWRDGELHKAQTTLEENLKTLRQTRYLKWFAARRLGFLGRLLREQGDYARARVVLEESRVCWRDMGVRRSDLGGTAEALIHLGRVVRLQGELAQAASDYAESLKQFREAGDKTGMADALLGLGDVSLAQGEHEQAAVHFKQSIALFHDVSDRPGVVLNLSGLAEVMRAQGHPKAAARLASAAAALQETIRVEDTHPDLSNYDRTVAAARLQLQDRTEAAAYAEGCALTMAQAIEYALVSADPRG